MKTETSPGGPVERIVGRHTPGPWAVNWAGSGRPGHAIVYDECYVYAPESSDDVAIASEIIDPLTGQLSDANARLIAAAPDLLSTLQRLCALYDSDEGCRELPQYKNAQAAVAKALGVTPNAIVTGAEPVDGASGGRNG